MTISSGRFPHVPCDYVHVPKTNGANAASDPQKAVGSYAVDDYVATVSVKVTREGADYFADVSIRGNLLDMGNASGKHLKLALDNGVLTAHQGGYDSFKLRVVDGRAQVEYHDFALERTFQFDLDRI